MTNQKWTFDHDSHRLVLFDSDNADAWVDCRDPVDVRNYE